MRKFEAGKRYGSILEGTTKSWERKRRQGSINGIAGRYLSQK